MPLGPDELKVLQRVDAAGLLRIPLFVAFYVASVGTVLGLVRLGVPWWACLPLHLSAGASLHGISLFTHEGVHGALATRPLVNRLLAAVCAWPVLQNFAAYKVLHLRHHADLGGPGDPDHYPNYASWPLVVWLMHWGRLLLGYPAYITAIPILGWRKATWAERRWIALEVAAVVAGMVAAVLWVPTPWLVHGWLIPMVFINTLVNIRGMSQHTLLPEAEHAFRGSRTILCGPVVRFFMCNENFHLEHHLHPRVPWYNLPRVHALLREELGEQRAPLIPSYSSFVWRFVEASVQRLRRAQA